jgi:hypothetical protein
VTVYAGLRLWSFAGVAGHAISFPDSYDYDETARKPLFSLDFWTWFKPWGIPLVWKLLPGSTSAVAPIAQWLISVAAWLALAAAVHRTLEHPVVKRVGFLLVLGFSLVPAVAVWDGALLSESLSLSLAALLVAAMLMLVHEPRWRWAIALIAVALLLGGTRTTNGYLAPFLLLPVAAAIVGRGRRIALAVAAAALVIPAAINSSANVRQWQVALGEIIALRVLHNPGELRYFEQRGMPVTPTLEQDIFANRSPQSQFEAAPALKPFVPWFRSRARGVYLDYLISHPTSTIADPIRDLRGMVSPSDSLTDIQGLPLPFYAASGYRDALPDALNRGLYPSSVALLFAWLTATALTAAGLVSIRRYTWVVAAVLLGSALPHAIIIWTGDSTAIGRHALLLAVYFRLGLVLLTLQLVDAILLVSRPASRIGPVTARNV